MAPNLKKFEFFTRLVDYLSYVIGPGRLQMSTRTIDAVRGIDRPANLTKLLSSLELFSVFWQFILPIFACVVTLLNKQPRNGPLEAFYRLSDEQITALETLKVKLIESPELGLQRLQGDYMVDTDAYNKKTGCIILQMQRYGTDKPIRCWSHSLNDAERAYDTTHCERLTVVWAVLLLRSYLRACHFTVRTNHDAL